MKKLRRSNLVRSVSIPENTADPSTTSAKSASNWSSLVLVSFLDQSLRFSLSTDMYHVADTRLPGYDFPTPSIKAS